MLDDDVILDSTRRLVLRHDRDLYRGDSIMPGVTTRLKSLEDWKDEMGEKVDNVNKTLNRALWLLIATLAGVVVDILTKGK